MRTTVRLPEPMMEEAKKAASQRGETLTSLIEKGLRLVLARPADGGKRQRVKLPVCTAGGGLMPGVDIDNSASLLDKMDPRKG